MPLFLKLRGRVKVLQLPDYRPAVIGKADSDFEWEIIGKRPRLDGEYTEVRSGPLGTKYLIRTADRNGNPVNPSELDYRK